MELPEHYVDGLVFRQDDIIRLKIPLVAKPAPRVVWFFENEPISSSGNELQIVTTEEFTSLKINSARRWHCGEFRVYAENENGEDACAVLVTVTGRLACMRMFFPSCSFHTNSIRSLYELSLSKHHRLPRASLW